MKTVMIILIASFMMMTSLKGQWEIVKKISISSGDEITLSDVYFINQVKGFACGGGFVWHGQWGRIFMTNDGGLSWKTVFSLENYPRWLYFVNDLTGYLTSSDWLDGNAILYKTVDGGETWIEVRSEIRNVFFVNERIGFGSSTISERDGIYKTNDGGETWEVMWTCQEDLCYIGSIFFLDEVTGWVVLQDHQLLKFSGYQDWKIINPPSGLPLNEIFFGDRTTGWIAGGYSSEDEFNPILLRTEDGGESWIKTDNITYLIHDFYFLNKTQGWAVGETSDEEGVIIETNDGGDTWQMVAENPSGLLQAIHFKYGNGWAVGYGGVVFKSNYIGLIQSNNFENIFLERVTMDNDLCVTPGADTVCISALILNPSDYSLKVYAVIRSQDGIICDTITMTHMGGELWKAHWPVIAGERFYATDILLARTDTTNANYSYLEFSRFTTAGPLSVQDLFISSSDTIPNPSDRMHLSLILKNEGLIKSITKISVKLTVLGTNATLNPDWKSIPYIPAGEMCQSEKWNFTISGNCPIDTAIPIKVDIASEGYVYWSDTLSIYVEKPPDIDNTSLMNIYPNPARNIVNVDLPYAHATKTVVELYDMTGTVLYRSEYKTIIVSSVDRIDVSGLPEGMYFVKVSRGQDVAVRKLMVY